VFGNKDRKIQRLLEIGRRVRQAEDGLSQADLARELDVSRGTINKDLGIIQDQTGILLSEDGNGRLHWFGRRR
jgi:predicted DNA-binding transcriptional regulator YafY